LVNLTERIEAQLSELNTQPTPEQIISKQPRAD
jgi:hypothetical protein